MFYILLFDCVQDYYAVCSVHSGSSYGQEEALFLTETLLSGLFEHGAAGNLKFL